MNNDITRKCHYSHLIFRKGTESMHWRKGIKLHYHINLQPELLLVKIFKVDQSAEEKESFIDCWYRYKLVKSTLKTVENFLKKKN